MRQDGNSDSSKAAEIAIPCIATTCADDRAIFVTGYDYRNTDQPGRYGPPEMVGTERKGIFGIREDEERTICTSHVERHNLTIRTLMKRFTRLSLGFSKKLENLEAACAIFLAYYNFCWRTRKPDEGKCRLPAAMMAGVVDTLWSFEDLYDAVMGSRYKIAA